jgi:hypothetical protein
MVHALEDVWRVLIPGGILLDLRPFSSNPPLEVIDADGIVLPVGRLDDTPGMTEDVAANDAIGRLTRDGLFAQERNGSFPLSSNWDTLDELLAHASTFWVGSMNLTDDVVERARSLMQGAGEGARLRLWMHMVIARYRKTQPEATPQKY